MTTDQLPKLINARPFRPFVLRTADDREVEHPENIAYGGGRGAVVVVQDDVEILDFLLIPSMRPKEALDGAAWPGCDQPLGCSRSDHSLTSVLEANEWRGCFSE